MNTDIAAEQSSRASAPERHPEVWEAAPRLLAVRGGVRRQAHHQLIHCGVALRAHQDVRSRASRRAIRRVPSTHGGRCSAALRAQRAHERHDGRRLASARRTLTRASHALSMTVGFPQVGNDAGVLCLSPAHVLPRSATHRHMGLYASLKPQSLTSLIRNPGGVRSMPG